MVNKTETPGAQRKELPDEIKKEYETMKYSANKKLNAVLNEIERELLTISDDEHESMNEIRRYMKEFRNEPDYNIAQYGNMLVYYADIYELYRSCGYTSTDKYSADRIWETYLRQTGYVARQLAKELTK